MGFIKNYFTGKKISFYVAFVFAVLSVIVGIAYGATWTKGYESPVALILFVAGGLLFVVLSVYNSKIAAATLSICDFAGFACYIISTYDIILTKAISGLNFSDPEVIKVIVFVALMLAVSIASNVFAWIDTEKKNAVSPEPVAAEKGELR